MKKKNNKSVIQITKYGERKIVQVWENQGADRYKLTGGYVDYGRSFAADKASEKLLKAIFSTADL